MTLSAVYGRVARLRRSWYERHPQSRRALDSTVISVGNLSVGGSGKTPVVAALARLLLDIGQRPAILSRGYGRPRALDGVVVASDGDRVLEPVERTGDEPQMLARALKGVPVLVSPDRHVAGRLAERRFGCTVMLLDDGFQHLELRRDVDLLLVSCADLDDRVLPAGRLREGLDAARSADCLLVPGPPEEVARVSAAFDGMQVFSVVNHYRPLRPLDETASLPAGLRRVAAAAGIARPQRFFSALREQGFDVAREIVFSDHHWFTTGDVESVGRAARDAGAELIVTTEKDAARLPPLPGWATLPMVAAIEPEGQFRSWLQGRL
ncbi:MAG TPA: tetraacyldisaccharide 4'-kinase [Vicinamibacterales bacterium]|nr:tetraacyldisaccharide 4'-kinase [Vicinamibacterales bacterium]